MRLAREVASSTLRTLRVLRLPRPAVGRGTTLQNGAEGLARYSCVIDATCVQAIQSVVRVQILGWGAGVRKRLRANSASRAIFRRSSAPLLQTSKTAQGITVVQQRGRMVRTMVRAQDERRACSRTKAATDKETAAQAQGGQEARVIRRQKSWALLAAASPLSCLRELRLRRPLLEAARPLDLTTQLKPGAQQTRVWNQAQRVPAPLASWARLRASGGWTCRGGPACRSGRLSTRM
jgi:hypothetical protein